MKLRNGVEIPTLGLGTFRSKPSDVKEAVLTALKAGYRHIDTAMIYENEEAIGEALKYAFANGIVTREEVFITTKLWNTDQGYESAKKALALSLKKLQLDYVDLYLIHWPLTYISTANSWRAMEEMYESGLTRAIGVSNFNIHHINNLLAVCKVIPMVNQVECHVKLQNDILNEYCNKFDIRLEAYAPFMSHEINELFSDQTMIAIAKKHNASIPQIVLAWLKKRNIIAIPKSITPKRIIENISYLDVCLNQEDLVAIKALNRGCRYFPEPDNIYF